MKKLAILAGALALSAYVGYRAAIVYATRRPITFTGPLTTEPRRDYP